MNINGAGVGTSLLDISSYAQKSKPEKMPLDKAVTEENRTSKVNEGLDLSNVQQQDFGVANIQYINANNPSETVNYDHPNALDKNIYTALKASDETSAAVISSSAKFTSLTKEIVISRPELLGKDWGFTINENDEIEILRGGSLSSEDIGFLEEKLEILNENKELIKLADAIVTDSKADAGIGASQLGKYDITRSNISKLDLRDVLTERKFTDELGRLQRQAAINLKDDLRKDSISIDVRV